MPPRKSNNTDDQWLRLFKEALSPERQPKGKGWLTYAEIRKRIGCGESKAYKFLKEGVKQGSLERFDGLKNVGHKAVREVWYRPTTLKGVKTP